MSSEALPPLGGSETWEEMAARVAGEITDMTNLTYAMNLARSMQAYAHVGFSHEQAFQLTLVEHQTRMEIITSHAVMNGLQGPDA